MNSIWIISPGFVGWTGCAQSMQLTARNLTFVSIKCGNVIDDLSHYKIVKIPQLPSFAAAAATAATTTTNKRFNSQTLPLSRANIHDSELQTAQVYLFIAECIGGNCLSSLRYIHFNCTLIFIFYYNCGSCLFLH